MNTIVSNLFLLTSSSSPVFSYFTSLFAHLYIPYLCFATVIIISFVQILYFFPYNPFLVISTSLLPTVLEPCHPLRVCLYTLCATQCLFYAKGIIPAPII